MGNFQPLEVVDRGSETQLQVVENLNNFTQQGRVNNNFDTYKLGQNVSRELNLG